MKRPPWADATGGVVADEQMSNDEAAVSLFNWRVELPVLSGRAVTLREPVGSDRDALLEVLSLPDATRFDLDGPLGPSAVQRLIDRAWRDRAAGVAFTYAIALATTRTIVGLIQVRQLDPIFETAAWECTLLPHARGTGTFYDAAHLVGSFAFAAAGASRLEARVDVDNGRAKAALRKLGGVQEGILRRSTRRGPAFIDQALWAVLKDSWDSCATPPAVVVH